MSESNIASINTEMKESHEISLVEMKINDASSPGYQVEFSPSEAEVLGAFEDDSLTEQEALESIYGSEEKDD